MYYSNIRHPMIVMIFYSFVSYNILTQDSSRIKKGKVVFMHDTDILDVIDSPENKKKKIEKRDNSCGKTKIDDYFRIKYKKESELCIQNLS